MPSYCWITVFFLTPLIFRYHLPLTAEKTAITAITIPYRYSNKRGEIPKTNINSLWDLELTIFFKSPMAPSPLSIVQCPYISISFKLNKYPFTFAIHRLVLQILKKIMQKFFNCIPHIFVFCSLPFHHHIVKQNTQAFHKQFFLQSLLPAEFYIRWLILSNSVQALGILYIIIEKENILKLPFCNPSME